MQMNVQEVTLDPLAGGPGHDWKVSHGNQSGSDPATYPRITLDPKSGPWLIHFKINDPGNNVTFAQDPIWVQPNSKPTGHVIDPQISAVVPSADGKELFVVDRNSNKDPQTLYYSLQFTGHGKLDPIIDNGGHPYTSPGGTYSSNTMTLNYMSLAILLFAALLVGGALGWAIKRRA